MNLEIRTYEDRDRPAIVRMSEEIVQDGTVFPFEDVEGVLAYWFSPGSTTLVAHEGDEVIASYAMKPNHPGRCAHVCNVGYMVAESARGRGIGKALGKHSLALAKELGYSAMQFNQVVATNTAAIRLWQNLGFRILGELPKTFRHPAQGLVDMYVMFREL